MVRLLLLSGLALLLLTLESVVVQQLGMVLTRIDVTVVLVAFLSLRAPRTSEGAMGAFAVGYLLDLMSGQPTGLFTFLAVFVFLLGRAIAGFVDVRTRAAFALFAMGADAAHGLLAAFFTWLTAREGGASAVLPAIPAQVVLTGAAALLLYRPLRRLEPGQQDRSLGVLR